MSIKPLTLFFVGGWLVGCAPAWENTGLQGPWCGPDARARVFRRAVATFNGPMSRQECYENKSGVKKREISFMRELDDYFAQDSFLNQWPEERGTVNGIKQHKPPFDLYLVSMEPTVIVGVEKQVPAVNSLHSQPAAKRCFVHSTYIAASIEVQTTLPYHEGAQVVWFSPAADRDLHELDLQSGYASFALKETEQFTVSIHGSQLTTSRK